MRAQILVEVNTDPTPGWGHNPQDFVKTIQSTLDAMIGHYNPVVSLHEKAPNNIVVEDSDGRFIVISNGMVTASFRHLSDATTFTEIQEQLS